MLLVIAGATATGKTELSLDVAERLSRRSDVVARCHGLRDNLEAERSCCLGNRVDLHLRVDLAGGVDDANLLCVGHDLLEQRKLLIDRREVTRSGDVAARCLIQVNKLALDGVGDGGEQNRDISDGLRRGLG